MTEITDQESSEHIQAVVEQVRAKVEHALRTNFGRYNAYTLREFKGRLSTDPNKISHFSDNEFYGNCGTFTSELSKALQEEGLELPTYTSSREDSNWHGYLIANDDGVEVIIDPTIGQFIQGHNHTFVGTRRELRELVLNKTGDGKPYKIVNTKSRYNPAEAFERTWGNESKKVGW